MCRRQRLQGARARTAVAAAAQHASELHHFLPRLVSTHTLTPTPALPRARQVITRDGNELEVLIDHTLEYELTVGNCIKDCRWDESGNALLVTATNGYLWCFDFQTVGW